MGRGGGMWREEAKAPQVKTRGPELPTDGPDDATRLKGHHSCQGENSRLITSNWCAPQLPMCHSWFHRGVNPPFRKADRLSLAMGRCCVDIVTEYSYV